MAGNRIKGITVEIGGDTTKLQTALKGVNTEIRNTQSQLKDVEKLLKLYFPCGSVEWDPGNGHGSVECDFSISWFCLEWD